MNILTLEDIAKLEADTPVSAIQVTIKNIGKTASGTIKKGPRKGDEWHVQDVKVEDDTGEMLIKNWGEPLPKTDVGETFLIESHHGKRGLSGLKVAWDDYNEETCLTMNESAKIKSPDGSPAPKMAADPEPDQERQTAGEVTREDNRVTKRDTVTRKAKTPMEIGLQAAAGCRIAAKLALLLAEEMKDEFAKVTGESVTPEQINSWSSSINYHLRDQGMLPFLKITDDLPVAAAKHEPEPEPTEDEIPF
jgi:hypothetical protein